MIGSPGQALSAFSASARKPSVRRGLAKAWARVLAHALGSAGGSGLSKSVFAGWSGIGSRRGGDVLLSRLANPNLRRRNSPGRSTLASRHSPRVNKFLCAPRDVLERRTVRLEQSLADFLTVHEQSDQGRIRWDQIGDALDDELHLLAGSGSREC